MLGEFEQIEAAFGIEKAADLRKACRYLKWTPDLGPPVKV